MPLLYLLGLAGAIFVGVSVLGGRAKANVHVTPTETSSRIPGLPKIPTVPFPSIATSVSVEVLPGDRVQIDGVDTDLHALFSRARGVQTALVSMHPGVRGAWAIRVVEQLKATGIEVQYVDV